MELLAPAKDFACLRAAIANGADAVYLGGSAFSARAAANSFDNESLRAAVDYAHVRGAAIHLAVNTLMKDSERDELCQLLEYGCKIGVDAVIVQDLGVASIARKYVPELPLHASTQMTIYSPEGVCMAEELGFSRAVLAREVSKAALRKIRRASRIELEYFVHGALCICYSGQCYMSSLYGGRSGNRGQCAQPCRLPYELQCDGKTIARGPLLSPKDLCLAGRLDELVELGVDSLKIEGRLKSPEYVGAVTRVYHSALHEGADERQIAEMLSFFSRGGSCEGYFDGPQYGKMMTVDEGAKITSAGKAEKEIRQTFAPEVENIRRPVTMTASLTVGEPARLTCSQGNAGVEITGPVCELAENRPLDAGRVAAQLEKLGGTPFAADKVDVLVDGQAVIPIRELNQMRREAVEQLSIAIAEQARRTVKNPTPARPGKQLAQSRPELSAWVTTREQLEAVLEHGITRIYAPLELCGAIPEDDKVFWVLPTIADDVDALRRRLGNRRRVLVNNIGLIHAFRSYDMVGGPRLNLFNPDGAAALSDCGLQAAFASMEVNLRELESITGILPLEAIVYGHVPLMLSENCFIRSADQCGCEGRQYSIVDRKGEVLPILKEGCRNMILNAKPVYMADRAQELEKVKINYWNLYFTVENQKNCGKIINEYSGALSGKMAQAPENFTRGHFYRGVK